MVLKKTLINWLVFLLTLLFFVLVAEIGMRIFISDRLHLHKDERNLTYKYDSNLGWFPVENSKKLNKGSRTVSVKHNSRGFRDSEHVVDVKPAIIFLGDSFVWGYDVEETERFTDKLRRKLPDWSIYNLGVSGFGTDQEYLLLKKHYAFYRPNIVFLVFCTDNDELDNSSNERYRGFYKPYFVINENNVELRGIPVPKSKNYFFVNHNTLAKSYWFRLFANLYFKFTSPPYLNLENPTHAIIVNMNEFVRRGGGQFIVGLTGQSSELEIFLRDKKIPFVSLSNSHRYPTHGEHWTPEGHTFVSEKIYEFFMKGNYLKKRTVPNNAINTDS